MYPSAPCKNCKKRVLHCHGTCKAYIAYQKELEILREQRIKNNDEYGLYVEMVTYTRKKVRK